MKRFLLRLRFVGTDFVGWQVQQNGYSLQTCMQDALEKIFGERLDVTGCSRTDSGVHANDYCMCFSVDTDRACDRISFGLNSVLPDSVQVWRCEEVAEDFHPRYHVTAKEYLYRMYDGRAGDPFLRGLAYHYHGTLDEKKMQKAADAFVGRHDFASLMAGGSKIVDTTREIYWCDIKRIGHEVQLRVCGDGFLYHMVRIIVGTLLFVNEGRFSPEDIPEILAKKDRSAAGKTAPAHGLYLNRVFYEPLEEVKRIGRKE